MHLDRENTRTPTHSPDLTHRQTSPRDTHVHLSRDWDPPARGQAASQPVWWQVPVFVSQQPGQICRFSLFVAAETAKFADTILPGLSSKCFLPSLSFFQRGCLSSSSLPDGIRWKTVNGTAPSYPCSCWGPRWWTVPMPRTLSPRLPWLTPSSPSSLWCPLLSKVQPSPLVLQCHDAINYYSWMSIKVEYDPRWFVFIYSAEWPCEVDIIVSDLQMKPNA